MLAQRGRTPEDIARPTIKLDRLLDDLPPGNSWDFRNQPASLYLPIARDLQIVVDPPDANPKPTEFVLDIVQTAIL